MAAEISLGCWILGLNNAAFRVKITLSEPVDHLKELIKKRMGNTLNHIDAFQLDIWKLKDPLSSRDVTNTLGEIGTSTKIPGAYKLDPLQGLSRYFVEAPVPGVVHVVVQLPPSAKRISPSSSRNTNMLGSAPLLEGWSPRVNTVQILYQKLDHYQVMQVRGTPASGKTTLSKLLLAHIKAKEPQAGVHLFAGWPEDRLDIWTRLQQRIPGYPSPKTVTYLLFDNGQDTYWDTFLWEFFFKDSQAFGKYRIILFCVYGSAGTRPISYLTGCPMKLDPRARVSLVRDSRSEDEFGTIGLLFSRNEFDDVLERAHEHSLDDDLKDQIFLWTGGHAGAVIDILRITTSAARRAKRDRMLLDLEGFLKIFPFETFLNDLSKAGTWARGLPTDSNLQDPEVADMFRDMLQFGSVKDTDSSPVIQNCHQNGWIFSTTVTTDQVVYVFPSPIHRLYFEWKLLPSSTLIPFATPLELSIAVIQGFQASQLSHAPRRVGNAGAVRPPEAAYQDEFYHSIFKVTNGCVRISSEYSPAKGASQSHIDFFIPSTKWGIALLRDGSNLEEHWSCSRLGGTYGAWLKSSDMADYIILDFRDTHPQKSHNDMDTLYHVVFSNKDFNNVQILNNKLEKVAGFALLEH